MSVVFAPAHDAIVGNVAPKQIAAVAEIDRTFAPAKTRRNALNAGIADFLESRIEGFDARIGIPGTGEGAQGHIVGKGILCPCRCRDGCSSRSQEIASAHLASHVSFL